MKFVLAIAASLLLLLAALALVPFLLRDRVVELVRSQVNERLEATVDFEDVDLSLLSTFPTFTVQIVGLEIIGKGRFEGKQRASVRLLGAGVEPIGLIRDEQLLIESFTIDYPELHLLVRNGALQHPDLAIPLTEIALDAKVKHPGGNLVAAAASLSPFDVILDALLGDDETISGDLKLTSTFIDIDEFSDEDFPFKVDVGLFLDLKKLMYKKQVLSNLRGSARYKDNTLRLTDVRTDARRYVQTSLSSLMK